MLGDVPVTALKSYFGDLAAGSGAVELIGSVLARMHGQSPPTLNYDQPDPACPINVAHGSLHPLDKPAAIALNQSNTGQAGSRRGRPRVTLTRRVHKQIRNAPFLVRQQCAKPRREPHVQTSKQSAKPTVNGSAAGRPRMITSPLAQPYYTPLPPPRQEPHAPRRQHHPVRPVVCIPAGDGAVGLGVDACRVASAAWTKGLINTPQH